MKKVKLGILGAGSFVQRRILPALKQVDSLAPVCLHNRSLEKAQKLARNFHIPHAVASREELINHPEVEAIFIATPNHCHEEDAIACTGKFVLCEKPLAPTAKAIQRMQAHFGKNQLFVGHSLRFKPAVQKARQLVQNNTLGELLHVRAYFTLPVPQDNWRFQESCGGGVLQDIGVHLVDLIRFITGQEITNVSAMGDLTSVTAIGKLDGGASLSLECSLNQPLRSGFEVIGTKARLISTESLRQTDLLGETLVLVSADDSQTKLPLKSNNIYEAELEHFAAVVLGKEKSLIDAQEALLNQQVIEALQVSLVN